MVFSKSKTLPYFFHRTYNEYWDHIDSIEQDFLDRMEKEQEPFFFQWIELRCKVIEQ